MTHNAQSNCNQYRASTCALTPFHNHHSHAQKGGRSQSPLSHQNADCIHADLLHRKYIDAHRDMAHCIARYNCAAADRRIPLSNVLPLLSDSFSNEMTPNLTASNPTRLNWSISTGLEIQFANIGKTQNKSRSLCANRESGKHAAFANHAPIHVNSTMIRLLFQGGFIYVQDTHTQARKHLFL